MSVLPVPVVTFPAVKVILLLTVTSLLMVRPVLVLFIVRLLNMVAPVKSLGRRAVERGRGRAGR